MQSGYVLMFKSCYRAVLRSAGKRCIGLWRLMDVDVAIRKVRYFHRHLIRYNAEQGINLLKNV